MNREVEGATVRKEGNGMTFKPLDPKKSDSNADLDRNDAAFLYPHCGKLFLAYTTAGPMGKKKRPRCGESIDCCTMKAKRSGGNAIVEE